MKRLVTPALEIPVISQPPFPRGLPSALTEEPVSRLALRTIALLDCSINSSTIKELGEAIMKRSDSTTARLYRIAIVNSTREPPDLASIKTAQEVCSAWRPGWMMSAELPDLG